MTVVNKSHLSNAHDFKLGSYSVILTFVLNLQVQEQLHCILTDVEEKCISSLFLFFVSC